MDPANLKYMIGDLLHGICGRICSYLDGDLETAQQFPAFMKDLEEEIEDEENSEWKGRRLGRKVPIEEEEEWRDTIADMFDGERVHEHVQPNKKFLGGKQYQRALGLFKATMAGEQLFSIQKSV
jgi:hypothetical protein